MNRRPPKPRAFTLIELMLVMVIIATAMAMAAPSLRGFWKGSRSRDAVQQLVAVTHWARTKAISESTVYRFNLETDGRSYYLTHLDGDEFANIESDFGRPFECPEGARLEFTTPHDRTYIDFFPNGRTEAATLRFFHDDNSEETFIAASSPAELFRVLSAEEALRTR